VIVLRVLVALLGVQLVAWTLMSALKAVVVPRAIVTTLTRAHFRALRWGSIVWPAVAHLRPTRRSVGPVAGCSVSMVFVVVPAVALNAVLDFSIGSAHTPLGR
jgi:hypothetical protein